MNREATYQQIFANQESLGTKLGRYEFVRNIDNTVKEFLKNIPKKAKYVARWQIQEVEVDSSQQEYLDSNNLSNYIVVADAVIEGRYTIGSYGLSANSSYLKDFHLDCIFETKNTLYVLCGDKAK